MKKFKPPPQDTTLRDRQVTELARLDDEENTRLKRLVRGRLGPGSLLSRRSGGRSESGGSTSSSGGGSGGANGAGTGMWSYSNWSPP